jgi:hypothetical protein
MLTLGLLRGYEAILNHSWNPSPCFNHNLWNNKFLFRILMSLMEFDSAFLLPLFPFEFQSSFSLLLNLPPIVL